MATQSIIYENKYKMINGSGHRQLAIENVAITCVEEPTMDIALAKQSQEGNATDMMQWMGWDFHLCTTSSLVLGHDH